MSETNTDTAPGWHREIDELHIFFEGYFLGTLDDLDRVEVALAPEFAIVGPDGQESNRGETLQMLRAGHAHTDSLKIRTSDHRLIRETDELVVASYIEHHELTSANNHRLSTVVFTVDPSGPNGLRWLRVHETWLGR